MIFDTKEEMPKFTVTADEKAKKEEVLWSNRQDTMREAVGELKPDGVTYFVTNGAWSMYELLQALHQFPCRSTSWYRVQQRCGTYHLR